ncbi:uncharacterized protein N0V89_011176 [Didymosphaeria variabile]|uniref:Ankyrin n=1 Tax=Didymosphaeria variabile TaxID=1932322 RepID=A0A9W8XEC5_9PLEO|nr:uncharacterized protein N0V89_011176 [Didymosphaeria variabile]KAJ4347237.1 hypothetical protein N0V89_011176 [Didymosphaeria variabile]
MDTSSNTEEASEKLRPVYERLWKFGALKGFEEKRKRLFRIVACAFESLTLMEATTMLRVGLEGDEPLYEERITINDVEKLCSNFLVKDTSDRLHWTHDSARDFVLGVILKDPSSRSNHELVADIFFSVIRDNKHPIWKNSLSKNQRRLFIPKDTLPRLGLNYVTYYADHHLRNAAERPSVFDAVWVRFFTEVILSDKSASTFWLRIWTSKLAAEHSGPESRSSVASTLGAPRVRSYISLHDLRPVLLASHVFASLDLGIENYQHTFPKSLTEGPTERNAPNLLLDSLGKHAACENEEQENGLVFAARVNYHIIPDLMLAVERYNGNSNRLRQLVGLTNNATKSSSSTPFLILCDRLCHEDSASLLNIAKRLLELEKHPSDAQMTEVCCQWSHVDQDIKDPALVRLIQAQAEDTVLELLSVHKPCEPNVQSSLRGGTALHGAACKGYFRIVKILVEDCHASLDMLDRNNRTPLEAVRKEHSELELLTTHWEDELELPIDPEIGNISELNQVIDYLEGVEVDNDAAGSLVHHL